jgi:outer membrane protein assembly factor BamB
MSLLQLVALALTVSAPAPKVGTEPGLDWPQWRGPNRDGVSQETGLLKEWPKDGPKLLWEFDKCGLGYSSFSVVGDTLYTMGADDDKNGNREYVLAIDANTGKEKWRTTTGTWFTTGTWGGGPRGTPTVDGDQLYVEGANGDLACLSRADGKVIWTKNLQKDLKGHRGGWGYAESVLIDGDHLLCTPGGSEGAMACLNKKTGDVVWRSSDFADGAHYVSIIAADVGGVRQYITATNGGVYGIRAKDGKRLWTDGKKAVNGVATIPTPIFYKDHVFFASGYGAGCALIQLIAAGDETQAKPVYHNKAIVNHHGGVIRVGENVYGHSESGSKWVCLPFLKADKPEGPEPVSTFNFDKGSCVYADGSLYCLAEEHANGKPGVLVKVHPSPDEWKEEGRFTLPKADPKRASSGGVWSHPVVAHGKLFVRDQNFLWCYDVSGK